MNYGICSFEKKILKKQIQAFKFYGDLFILLDFCYIVFVEFLRISLDRLLLIFYNFLLNLSWKNLSDFWVVNSSTNSFCLRNLSVCCHSNKKFEKSNSKSTFTSPIVHSSNDKHLNMVNNYSSIPRISTYIRYFIINNAYMKHTWLIANII